MTAFDLILIVIFFDVVFFFAGPQFDNWELSLITEFPPEFLKYKEIDYTVLAIDVNIDLC